MEKKKEDLLKKSIENSFSFKEKYNQFEINATLQLSVEQLDFLKNLSSIVMVFLGIGFIINKVDANIFSLLAFSLAVLSLTIFLAYIKERIDQEINQLKRTREYLEKEINEDINKAMEALKKNNEHIYYDYIEKKVTSGFVVSKQVNCLGEICLFLFYLILFSFVLVIILEKHVMTIASQLNFLLLIVTVSWLLSFREWSVKFMRILSKKSHFSFF